MSASSLRLAVVFAASAALALPAAATVVVVPTLEEMTWRSDVVVHAIVVDQQVIEQVKGRVVTRTVLDVQDGIAGANPKDLLTVEQLGGNLGSRRAWIAGAHKFKVGDEVVFFGVRLQNVVGESVVVPYGIGFGIFDVKDDVDGKHAVERGGEVTQLVRDENGVASMKAVTPRHYTSVDAFKAELRAILDGRNFSPPAQLKVIPTKAHPSPLRVPPTLTKTPSPTSKE